MPPKSSRSVPRRLADAWDDRGPQYLSLIFGGLFALGQVIIAEEVVTRFPEKARPWVSGIGFALVWIGGLAQIPIAWYAMQHHQRISLLEAEVAKREAEAEEWSHHLKNLVQGVLYSLAKELRFGEGEKKADRITIYAHEDGPGGGYFIPLGRVSFNTVYEKVGRRIYPDDQGVIAEAWRHGEVYRFAYPDPKVKPEAYIAQLGKEGIPAEVVGAIRMKSRFFYGRRISDAHGHRYLAVLILESKEPNRYTKEELREFFGKNEAMLSHLVERIGPILPKMTQVREAGF
jgi:hypothetical protein